MSNDFTFRITRIFDAPRALVWKAWTDKDMSSKWSGPKGCTIAYKSYDIKPGGEALYSMEYNGQKSWGKARYKEVTEMQKLVFLVSFTDENGHVITHPGASNWPKEILSTVTFADKGGKTEIALEWQAYHATDLEAKVFEAGMEGMNQGWTGSFDQLDALLKTFNHA